jgi:hypothetical protein
MLPVELAPPLCASAVAAAAEKTSARRGTIRLFIWMDLLSPVR